MGLTRHHSVKLWQLFHGHIRSEARLSIAMKDQMRFAIREGGKIGGAGIVAKTMA